MYEPIFHYGSYYSGWEVARQFLHSVFSIYLYDHKIIRRSYHRKKSINRVLQIGNYMGKNIILNSNLCNCFRIDCIIVKST